LGYMALVAKGLSICDESVGCPEKET